MLIARDFLGDDDFVMYLGDNLLQQGLTEFVERFETARAARLATARPAAQILLAHVDDPRQFGVAEVDDTGEVVQLVEKPADPPSDLALVGVYLFDRARARGRARDRAVGSRRARDHRRDPVAPRRRATACVHEVLEGWWIDTGKKDPLLESNRYMLERLEPANHGTVDAESSIEGRVVDRGGRRGRRARASAAPRSSASARRS